MCVLGFWFYWFIEWLVLIHVWFVFHFRVKIVMIFSIKLLVRRACWLNYISLNVKRRETKTKFITQLHSSATIECSTSKRLTDKKISSFLLIIIKIYGFHCIYCISCLHFHSIEILLSAEKKTHLNWITKTIDRKESIRSICCAICLP